MIQLSDVSFAYPGQAPVFQGFGWSVRQGEVWTVLGPSGCGKSSLLMLLAGLHLAQSGTTAIGGTTITRPRPGTGLILQEYGLLPWATVRGNVLLGLRIRRFYGPDGRHVPRDARITPTEANARVDHWLARLGIADVALTYPRQISGGQRQRTAIARTFVLHPDLLLMDEPFSALDAPTRESLQLLTLDLCAEAGVTVVLVTHNIEEAAFMGQKILVLNTPPNHTARIIDNPHAVTEAYRYSPPYQGICAALREIMNTAA